MNIISENVEKLYKIKKGFFKTADIKVVENFDYEIKQGDIVGFLGREGSGKSTIIRLLSGNILPTKGNVFIDGEIDYKKLKENSEIISDFSGRKLLCNETVYNNFVYFGTKYKQDVLDVEKNIATFKGVFELDRVINKKINELNTLDVMKVNIAISMLKNTSILFFDSALSNLNVVEKNTILKLLKRLNKEYKTTIVVSGNKLSDVEKICKRITIINKGKIVKDYLYEDLKRELGNKKEIQIIFNKNVSILKDNVEVIEQGDYFLKLRVDFDKCDFAKLISQFDVNSIVDITISNFYLLDL